MSISKKILIISLLAAFLTFALVGFSLAQREPEIDYPEIPGAPEITRETILPDYIVYIFNFALMIIGLVAFGALIWGGVRYLTSIGNPAAMADAKDQIFAGLLGLIILLSSYLILTTINPELIFLGLGEEKIKIREPGERKISTTITLPVEFRAYAIGTPIAADFHESLGDVNWDRTINIFDAVVLSKVFGLTSEDAGYDPNCDLNFDERIDISDIAIMGKNLDKAVEIYHITEEESAGEGLTLYIPFERAKPSRIFQAVLDRNNIEGVEVRHAIATTDITPIEVDFHFLGILPKEVSPACTELTEEINARDGAACGDPNYDPLYDVNKDQIIDLFDVERVGDCKGDGACCNGLKDPASPCPAPTCDEMQSRITTAFGESCGDAFYDPIADINKDQIVDAFDAAAFAICGMDEACCQ
ncbi:hypothetical protein KJA15_00870, partial [Patescibacteria group bacterium]|nr:hypothetical protein [Patescibacteria group bacterium]